MAETLASGQYCGTTLSSRNLPGLALTETRYAPGSRLAPHAHRNAYFCLVRQGTYEETFGSRMRRCGPSTLAFHPAGEQHSEEMGDSPVLSFNVEADAGWLERLGVSGRCFENAAGFEGGEAEHIAARLYREFRDSGAPSRLAVEGLALQTIAAASRLTATRPDSRRPAWFGRVLEILHERAAENISLAFLASEANIHPVYLARAFRKHQHASIGEYQRRLRVQLARGYMADPALSLEAIAARAGFADQSHLTRCFRRLMGVTPLDYRKQWLSRLPSY